MASVTIDLFKVDNKESVLLEWGILWEYRLLGVVFDGETQHAASDGLDVE